MGEWQEDWGEINTGKKVPALFVLELSDWTVSKVAGIPEGISAGQPTWAPTGTPSSSVGMDVGGSRRGLGGCGGGDGCGCGVWGGEGDEGSSTIVPKRTYSISACMRFLFNLLQSTPVAESCYLLAESC